jgi:flavin-dependent dehydrogenase
VADGKSQKSSLFAKVFVTVNRLMAIKTDVLIIGGGPGGSTAAMCLIREGIKPIILEQEAFPRFHIGESMTGEAAQLLRRLGRRTW